MRRIFPEIPPESNAWLILGIAGTLLGIANIYSSFYPSVYEENHPNAYHHPTILRGLSWLFLGLVFLIPAIKRKLKKK